MTALELNSQEVNLRSLQHISKYNYYNLGNVLTNKFKTKILLLFYIQNFKQKKRPDLKTVQTGDLFYGTFTKMAAFS